MGTSEVLVDGEGCVVALEELNDFSAKVVNLLNNKERRSELAISAKSYAKQWSAPVMAQKMATFYSYIAGERSKLEFEGTTAPSLES
jgi:glycosyltransferase involved in cell wall biosynthesis